MKRPAAGSVGMASSLLPAGADDSSLLRYSRARKQPSGRQLLRKPDLRYWVATPGSWRRKSGQRVIPAAWTRVANCSDMTRCTLLALALLLAAACGMAQPVKPVVGTISYEVSGGFTGWDRILIVDG